MQNRTRYIIAAALALCALLLFACEKREIKEPVSYNDAEFLMGGLVSQDRVSGSVNPIMGQFTADKEITIPVESYEEARELFESIISPDAQVERSGSSIIWHLTDGQGASMGDAVFDKGPGATLATLSLPAACDFVRTVKYATPRSDFLMVVDPDVKEDLEDNYYYGAIVNISDHGCGSGKFVVLREYNFNSGAAGMAIRLDSRRWHDSEMSQGSTGHDVASRASCLATMRTAGAIIRSDWNVITKQLVNAGSIMPTQHFYSADRYWTGLHYYYCFHDEETDTVGPFNDLEFYEAWIYWFQPSGNSIYFW